MKANKASLVLGFVLAAGFAAAAVDHDHDRAVERAKAAAKRDRANARRDAQSMLVESLRQARSINVIAIISRFGDCDKVLQRLKLEQRGMGEQFSTVLQPLSMQGVTYLDDGKKSLMYLPDQKIMFECQEQATEMAGEAADRMELAARNYEMNVESNVASLVAGRSTFCVVAKPKVAGLPSRQFYLDQKTLYPLRFATSGPDGQWKVSMDTQVVNFPKDMPCIAFNHIGAVRTIKFNPSVDLDSVRDASDRLGFDPVMPRSLPMGFEVQRSELRTNDQGQLAVLWLTDGLASARVYEFRDPSMQEGMWSLGANTVLTEDGVTMMMVSDLSTVVRKRLLQAFATRRPVQIAAPSEAPSVRIGGTHPPVPSEEPNGPQPVLSTPEPSARHGYASSDAGRP